MAWGATDGDLDLVELEAALKKLKLKARDTASQVARRLEEAEYWREREGVARDASKAVASWEASTKLLAAAMKPTLEVAISMLIVKKNLKPMDMLSQWDTDDGGSIGVEEFVKNLQKMGIAASREELEAIFNKLDESGGALLRCTPHTRILAYDPLLAVPTRAYRIVPYMRPWAHSVVPLARRPRAYLHCTVTRAHGVTTRYTSGVVGVGRRRVGYRGAEEGAEDALRGAAGGQGAGEAAQEGGRPV